LQRWGEELFACFGEDVPGRLEIEEASGWPSPLSFQGSTLFQLTHAESLLRLCPLHRSSVGWCLAAVLLLSSPGCSEGDSSIDDTVREDAASGGAVDGIGGTAVLSAGGASLSSGGVTTSGGTAGSGGLSSSVVGGAASASGGVENSGGSGSSSGGVFAAGGAGATGGVGGHGSGGGPDVVARFRVYLLIGQSNMAGGAETEDADRVEDERIRVLGFDDCASTGRVYNAWDTAAPPLHACWLNGMGPGDHFAKTLIEALPEGDTIGLVPCAIPGVDIDFFRKGVVSSRRTEFQIPPDDHWETAYDWVLERARLAQQDGGVIDGILFHQGESDSGQTVWLEKVQGMVADLRADLGLGEVPFIAGEMLRGGATEGHNDIINQLPGLISNAYVVSSEGLAGVDQFHFDSPGVRTIGQRYGETMIQALGLSND
jgi:hypothetical protein